MMGRVMGDEARGYYNVLRGATNMIFVAPNLIAFILNSILM